ncbi:MAG: hypothetical protein M3R69_04270 [Acidobacteriota bacterium]|nr:hypothetical protein [Acidobacteriota bacterium]
MLEGRRVLFISYNGMLDPLGQTQVLPYLRQLGKLGLKFTLLSFEREVAFTSEGAAACDQLRSELAGNNIEWHWLRYHKRPSIPATAYDVAAGIRYAGKLVKTNNIEMVHARSHIPATIALALKRRFGLKMIFDIRGLMADEYVDANHWQKGNIPYRLTKTMERRALTASDGVVTLTERIWPFIQEWEGLRGRDVIHEVVPCCADLELFKFSTENRIERRAELGLDDQLTFTYSGSIDGWYLTEQMADFCAHLVRGIPTAHFLWLVRSGHERINRLMTERGVSRRSYTIRAAASRDVPSYLAAADAGLAFIKPCFSKLASSPTKYAEYLGCGLPLVINAGIGDSDVLITQEGVGVLVRDFNALEYAKALEGIREFTNNADQTRARSRAVAERLFDVKEVGLRRYARLYENVLAGRRL